MSQEVTQVIRRGIIDYLTASNISWSGRLEETEFLARLYDLANKPSRDGQFANAAGDIFQHRIRNYDWSDDWVFYDPRFSLLHGPDEDFLRFLAETIHPVVRPDPSEATRSRRPTTRNSRRTAGNWWR